MFEEKHLRSGTRSEAGERLRARRELLPRVHGAERAQALIEFALIAPVMFVILFAIVDFSIAIDRRVMLQHAVREGARYGAVHEVCPDIVTRTLDQAQGIDDVSVDVSYPDGGDVGERVEVAADFTWEFPIFRELGGVFGVGPLSVDLTPSGAARLEKTVNPATGCTGSS